eukprot:COSAG01_NODE_2481_length_7603_cov_4.629398_9_plen_77_part_00
MHRAAESASVSHTLARAGAQLLHSLVPRRVSNSVDYETGAVTSRITTIACICYVRAHCATEVRAPVSVGTRESISS